MNRFEVGDRVVNVWTSQRSDLHRWLRWTFHRLELWGR